MDMVILQGTTGEWPSLPTPERLAMAAAWRQAVPPGSHMKLILHVGHDSLVDAQLLAQRAVSLRTVSRALVAAQVVQIEQPLHALVPNSDPAAPAAAAAR